MVQEIELGPDASKLFSISVCTMAKLQNLQLNTVKLDFLFCSTMCDIAEKSKVYLFMIFILTVIALKLFLMMAVSSIFTIHVIVFPCSLPNVITIINNNVLLQSHCLLYYNYAI